MDYGKFLKEKREAANMTRKDLASKAGVSKRSIYCWENGDRNMTLEHADRVFKALGVSIVIGKEGDLFE